MARGCICCCTSSGPGRLRRLVCAALSQRVTAGNFGRILTYLDRLPMEFATFGVRLAYKLKKEVATTKDFIKWATDHKDVLL